MRLKMRRHRLECESLETRALLSGVHSHMVAHPRAHAARHGAAPAAEVSGTSPVTGSGLVNVAPAPGYGSVGTLQGASSATELVIFLTQFEVLSGSNAATRQTAASMLNDARNVELALNAFASGEGISIPPNITGNDQILAQQMIAGIRAKQADQTFSTLIVQAEASLTAQFQVMATASQDASVRSFAAGILPTVQADLAAAQGTGTLAPVSSTPSSSTLSTADLNTLATYYSINLMERFLGQLTTLVTKRQPISLYAAKLIGDHEGANISLGIYAASTQTYLPASINASDTPMAMTVIAGLNSVRARSSARYDSIYLKQMIMGHAEALKFTASVIDTTQNPVLRQFAINVTPTVWMHLQSARTLYRRFR